MKITFPHMGGAYIAVKCFLEELGIDVIVPPDCSQKTLELGAKYTPETVCLPMKINIGNYIQSIEKGADTILITGSCGPCRFGYYGIIEQEILRDLGYNVKIIVFDPLHEDINAFIRKLKIIMNGNSVYKTYRSFLNAYNIAKQIDKCDKLIAYIKPREVNKGEAKRMKNKYLSDIQKIRGTKNVLYHLYYMEKDLKTIELYNNIKPIKIGIVGEIYTVIEPFVNLFIEEKLSSLGVQVDKSMSVSGWIDTNILGKIFKINKEKDIEEAAKPYLNYMIGGHARQCIGNGVLYCESGYDGVIQLLPFSCMPEIVARTILPSVAKNQNKPIMTLVLDELTGEAGYMTRLEAFVDMLKNRVYI